MADIEDKKTETTGGGAAGAAAGAVKAAAGGPAAVPRLLLSSSPHIAAGVTARTLMGRVLIALAPAAVFGVALYGLPALGVIVVSVAAAEAAEWAFRRATGQPARNGDLSAAVTGLLLALALPPDTPLWMAALGAVFAVVVAKEFFGGLGANVFNPALAGRAFLLMSFPAAITTWRAPWSWGAALDAVTTATPLGIVKNGAVEAVVVGDAVLDGLSRAFMEAGFPVNWGDQIAALFWGVHGGCIGETSVPLILAGFVFLLVTKTVDWRAPAAMFGSAVVFSWLFGRDPVFAALSGGLLFGAAFMATDYVSAPLTPYGKLIFGAGAGLITALIRGWGGYPEGVTYGILIMNAATPFLNRLLNRKFGYVKPKPKPAAAAPAGAAAKEAAR